MIEKEKSYRIGGISPSEITDKIISQYIHNRDVVLRGESYNPFVHSNSGQISVNEITFKFRQFAEGDHLEIWVIVECFDLAVVKAQEVFLFQKPELRAVVDLYRHDVVERRQWIWKAILRLSSFALQEKLRQDSVRQLWELKEGLERCGCSFLVQSLERLMVSRWRSWRDFGMSCSKKQVDGLLGFLREGVKLIDNNLSDWQRETEDFFFSN